MNNDNDVHATEEQLNTPHLYEDTFERWLAWTFDNLFIELALRAGDEDEFGNFVHNYGQNLLNDGKRTVGHAWAEFAARKYADALKSELA